MIKNIFVRKKDGTLEIFKIEKIINAVSKSSKRILHDFTEEEKSVLKNSVKEYIKEYITKKYDSDADEAEIPIAVMHSIVEMSLDKVDTRIAKSYRDYRNYKTSFVEMLDDIYKKAQNIMYIGDRENANTDSTLVSTKRSLIYNEFNKELYQKFQMDKETLQACREGYIYIHDMSARRDTMNCCLFDIATVLRNGFEMGNVFYNEPKSLDTAFDVMGDIILSAASQQYGGFTVSRVDEILNKYAELSYEKYKKDIYLSKSKSHKNDMSDSIVEELLKESEEEAKQKVERDFMQGFQGWEYKFNTVASSRGDYPFITITIGVGTKEFEKMATRCCLRVRKGGQGKPGFKKHVLFPKIVFTYTEELHGPGMPNEDLFEEGIDCSSKAMYPDWLSLDGDTDVARMWHKYGEIIAPMGCVDKDEVVTYKVDGKLYVESISRMWNRLADKFEVKMQSKNSPHLFMKLKNVSIYDSKKGFVDTKAMVQNVSTNWMDITLTNGRSIRCTTDHPFPVIGKGRIHAEDLKIGDKIPVIKTQYSEETIDKDIDLAWAYGVFLCDGCYDNHATVSIALENEDEIADKLKIVMEKEFDSHMSVKKRYRGKKGNYTDLSFSNYSRIHKEFIEKFSGLQKKYRHIPNEVFSYKRDAKLAFLAGMIDADGYIDGSENGISIVQLGSVNKELALQQMALMQSIGYRAKMYKNHYSKKNNNKIRYRVECDITEELAKYIQCEKKKNNISCVLRTNASIANEDYGEVKSIEYLDKHIEYSYDVTTESDHFDVSGIYSHNCRAFLSPYYERGGTEPADENDRPFFIGRFNIGAVSLNLPMILMKSRHENLDFYKVLDYYLELIRRTHKMTYEYLGEMKASCNPLAYCEGGFHDGFLKPTDKIRPLLKYTTASFGITALNELNELYNGKSIYEDGEFPLEVMKYISEVKLPQFKEEDHINYAVYGTPAESLCSTQVKQFRAKYGIVPNVSDRGYVSNSFHCHVSEDIDGIQKQDSELRFWNLHKGGRIQYVKYGIDYNKDAIRTYVRRAMSLGLYEGVNLVLSYCEDCGHSENGMDECPVCHSKNICKIERMNGYLAYSRVHGHTRLNDGKMEEIGDRKSM